jgi:catechol 2,3-dioxygenase-like lactoylglutathione lyase family enzyme
MTTENTITVTFDVNGKSYSGDVRAMQIVHEAMDKLLPHEVLHANRLRVTRPDGELIYPDMFVGEIAEHYGDAHLLVEATPLREEAGEWTNYGFDHLALATTERAHARDFFSQGLKMKIVRDDEHLTVVTTGNTAIFLFDAKPGAPLSDGLPSRIHHIGFVVDNLEAAYGHLRRTFPAFTSDFTLLERAERFSLYGHITFGDVRFMIQLSEVKPEFRGFRDGTPFVGFMYDYAARDYGVRLG